MNQLLFGGLFLVYVLSFTSSTTTYVAIDTPPIVKVATSSPEWIKGRISHYADYYDVSEITMMNIVNCESRYNQNAINSSPLEYSVGLVQINLRAHLKNGITKEMALDPEFSLDFLARMLKQGEGSMWTCWKMN